MLNILKNYLIFTETSFLPERKKLEKAKKLACGIEDEKKNMLFT